MKFAGKTLKEYFVASKKFLILAFVLTFINVILRLFLESIGGYQNIFTILGLIIVIWSGWSLARNNRLNLKQISFVGILLFLTTNWSLLIFHDNILEIMQLALINALIFVAITVFSGWVAKKI